VRSTSPPNLCHLPPFEHDVDHSRPTSGNIFATGEVVEQPARVFPLPALGLLAAPELSGFEQELAELLGEPS